MAIEELGESLLANIRSRNDKIARDNRKKERKQELLGLGAAIAVGVGNKMLADRTASFLDNEEILASNVLFKNASKGKIEAEQELANIKSQANGNALQYYTDQIKPSFETEFKNKVNLDEYGTQAYDDLVNSEVKKLAQMRVDALNNLVNASKTIRSADTVTAEQARIIKNVRPSSVGNLITTGLANLFDGQSSAEREKAAVAAISQNDTNRERVIALTKAFEETGSLVNAYDFANLTVPKTAKEKRFQTVTSFNIQVIDDEAFLIEQTSVKDRFGKLPEQEQKPTASKLFEGTPDAVNSKILKAAKTSYNLAEKPQSLLTAPAYAEFVKAVHKEKITLGNIRTMAEYSTVANILQDFTQVEENLQDSSKTQLTASLVSSLAKNSISLQRQLTTGSPQEKLTALSNLKEISDLFTQMTQGSRIIQSTINGELKNVLVDEDGNPIEVLD